MLLYDRDLPLPAALIKDNSLEKVPAAHAEMRRAVIENRPDLLLIRSTFKVDSGLAKHLEGCRILSATAGSDHLDLPALRDCGAQVFLAAGVNATAVVEYVITSIGLWLELADRHLSEISVGIVGCGHVGSQLARRLVGLVAKVHACDPFLKPRQFPHGTVAHSDFAAMQSQVDLLSFHVPLTETGPYPTMQAWNADNTSLSNNKTALLINTARGAVWHTDLFATPCSRISDVWQHEPAPDPAHVAATQLATPHLAGHTHRARQQAVATVIDQALEHLHIHTRNSASVEISVESGLKSADREIAKHGLPVTLLLQAGRFQQVDAAMRSLKGGNFSAIRAESIRHQWCDISFTLSNTAGALSQPAQDLLVELGFNQAQM